MTTSSSGKTAGSQHIDEETLDAAIGWHLRLKDESATAQDQLDFKVWLARCDRHTTAYQEAIHLWEETEAPARLLWLAQDQRRPTHKPRSQRITSNHRRWAAAAVLMLTMLLSFELWHDPGRMDRWMADISTSSGQSQQALLEDGSSLFLDGNSALDVKLDDTQRVLTLRRGRMWINVANDPQRPLQLTAGDAFISVLGTHFAVSRFHSRVTITVEEGQVAVRDTHHNQVLLNAGQQLTVLNGEFKEVHTIDPRLVLAWKEGRIIFDQAGIDDIAEQLERSLTGRVLFDAQDFADLSFSGSFPTSRPETLIDTLKNAPAIKAHRLPGDIIWLRSTSTG